MASVHQACYELRKNGGGHGGDGCIDGKCDGVYNRCLLVIYYEKSSLNTNPIAMTTCS